MGITIQWDNEDKTIIRQTFDGSWTWEDLYQSMDYMQELTGKADHIVDAIIDVRKAAMVPGGSIFTPRARQGADDIADRINGETGAIVVVGANPFLKGLYETFRGLYRDKISDVMFSRDVDDARQKLAARRIDSIAV